MAQKIDTPCCSYTLEKKVKGKVTTYGAEDLLPLLPLCLSVILTSNVSENL